MRIALPDNGQLEHDDIADVLQPDFLHYVAAFKLPCLCHIQHIIKRIVRMGGRAEEASVIVSVTYYDLVDNVLDPRATRSKYRDERNAIGETLLHEVFQERFIRNGNMQDDFATVRHF